MRRNLPAYACEFAGTALMLFIGISAVAFMWGPGSPVPAVDNPMLRRLLTGIMFAGGATAVVYSPLGQVSGGHINPAMTLAFWWLGKVPARDALAYAAAQFAGAFAGAYAAGLAWGRLTSGIQYAATVPGAGYTQAGAFAAETFITFLLVFTIFVCVNKPRLAARTGLIAGALVAVLVMIEGPVTGTSLNPARSLAPAVLSSTYDGLWVYFAGPIAGGLLAAAAYRGQWGQQTVCAKLYHTEKYPCPFETCSYRLVSRGETVMTQGDPGSEAYVVERGALDVRRDAGVALARLGPGDWVGEMSLLLDEPRSATVVAATDAQLRRVTKHDMAHVLAEDPRRTEELLRQLARRVKAVSERLAGRV
ncbi:MAG TPA: aquaporin [Vicinamibacterales bacterium]|nr:aquaporin [Vicinamibacterales bacterium]